MEPYTYTTLSHAQCFRLLRLPEKADGAYELQDFTLKEPPPYEALSYVWGDSVNDRKSIRIQAGAHISELAITQTLATALPYICKHRQCDYIWCDQICIDQENMDEKGCQVRMMGEIYRNASGVIVWLGESSVQTRSVITLLDDLGARELGYDWSEMTENIQGVGDPVQQALEHDLRIWISGKLRLLGDDQVQRGIDDLELLEIWEELDVMISTILDLPWFTRVWVMQEVLLSRRTRVLLGDDVFAFAALARLVQATRVVSWELEGLGIPNIDGSFRFEPHDDTEGGRPLMFVARWRCLSEGYLDRTLFGLLCDLRAGAIRGRLRASDSRDLVYGFLGLANLQEPFTIFPDYSSNARMVFTLSARAIVASRRDLSILTICDGVDSQPESEKSLDGNVLPSWVPDWRYALRRHTIRPYNFESKHEAPFMTRYDQLPVSGHIVDTVISSDRQLFSTLKKFYHAMLVQHDAFAQFREDYEEERYCSMAYAALSDRLEVVAEQTGFKLEAHDVFRSCWQLSPAWWHDNINSFCENALEKLVHLILGGIAHYGCATVPVGSSSPLHEHEHQCPEIIPHGEWRDFGSSDFCCHGVDVYCFCEGVAGEATTCGSDESYTLGPCEMNDLRLLMLGQLALEDCHFDKLALTASGRLMISHDNVRNNDAICLLRGFRIPAILREESPGCYSFVSGGLCVGLMDEEGTSANPWAAEDDRSIILI